MFIPEIVIGMIAGFVLGVTTLAIIAVICARRADDEQELEDR